MASTDRRALIVGAGPAGLTAAMEFQKLGVETVIIEKGRVVGGISRTECHDGNHFDMGGHRFYTKVGEIESIWHSLLGDQFLARPRLSRIFYRKKYFKYPPQLLSTLRGFGIVESCLIIWSYVWWHIFPHHDVKTFDQWVTNAFGKRLFVHFFKSYTEKVWGLPCSELSADWARQRIKELSIKTIIQSKIPGFRKRVTSLIETFHYPARGPGMMWEAAGENVVSQGGALRMDSECIRVCRTGMTVDSVVCKTDSGESVELADYFISTMPINELIAKIEPPPPEEVLIAAAALKHRDFLTVCIIVDHPSLFPDNWIYIHDPEVKVARIQNYKNWSPEMVANKDHTSLGLEYFCNKGDDVWCMEDRDLIELASRELLHIGLVGNERVIEGFVHRVENAYPVYDTTYEENLRVVAEFCDQLVNFRTVGRNGLHRYNNQDHSMLTGLYAARMLALGESHDIWKINAEQEYLERSEVPSA